MQNFSALGNFINSFLQHQATRAAANIVVGANAATKSAQAAQNTPVAPQNQSFLPKQTSINTQLEMAKMENTERAVLIKELLNLPKDLKSLIATMQNTQNANSTNSAQNLQNLNVEQLMKMMETNGKEALSKIMQMTGMLNKLGNVDTKQLQELQFIVNACIPHANMTNTQFMKNLILLYLPWLPIGENNNFDIDFSCSEESGTEDSADDTITILIQTENYGNVKVLLILEATNKVNTVVNCSKTFPKELLQMKLKDISKEYKLESSVAINEQETVSNSPVDKSQKVHMSGASVLNPYVLLMAHAVIRSVIEIDKNQTLVSTRKQKSSEGK